MKPFVLAFAVAVPLFGQAQPLLPYIHVFPSSIGQIGQAYELIGDIDQDGVPEIAATERNVYYVYPSGCCPFPVEVTALRVFSGRAGTLLFSHVDLPSSYQVTSRFQVADAGDLDFDGKPDIAWSHDYGSTYEILRVMSTQTGAVLRQWTFTGLATGYKIAVVGMSDADGDGVRDLAVGEPLVSALGLGRVTIYSGATGAIVRTILEPSSFGGSFGQALVAVDDIDGDGMTDLVVGAPLAPNGGMCVAYSGATGAVLWTRPANNASIQLGMSLALAGDVNGDGIQDVIAGAPASAPAFGRVLWLSGATGAVLNTVIGTVGSFGIAVGGGHDVNGDGSPDVAVGTSSSHEVSIYSATGALLKTYQGGTGYGYTAMISQDLNGDGYGEVITSDTGPASYLSVQAVVGAQPYGTSGGPLLGWTAGAPVPSVGQLTITGATQFGPGAIAASQSWAPPSGTPPALINIAIANLVLIQPVSFDATGAYAIPLDLHDPALGGLTFYLQAADFVPSGVTTSNPLQILFN